MHGAVVVGLHRWFGGPNNGIPVGSNRHRRCLRSIPYEGTYCCGHDVDPFVDYW
ncbi:putative synaptotagmin-2 [Iris pallida]|uniref:Synaptotagmin-2 n=1 Tax=Iris pallida TaxID=29817 RepID=A0AAX6FAF5_IRIPA|nr:putative synaptotagmin-2 [Iris pallida]